MGDVALINNCDCTAAILAEGCVEVCSVEAQSLPADDSYLGLAGDDSGLPAGFWDALYPESTLIFKSPEPVVFTDDELKVQARSMLASVRRQPWNFAYVHWDVVGDAESIDVFLNPPDEKLDTESLTPNQKIARYLDDDSQYKNQFLQAYKKGDFTHYDQEDWLDFRGRLYEDLLVGDDVMDEFLEMISSIDSIVETGIYDSKHPYYASRVHTVVVNLNKVVSSDEFYSENQEFQGSHVAKSLATFDVHLLDYFWDVVSAILDTDEYLDEDLESRQQLLQRVDRTLLADLGEKRFIDEPTLNLVGVILRELGRILETNEESHELARRVSALEFIEDALSESYNLSNPIDLSLHSEFNPNSYYAAPPIALIDVFTHINLIKIAQDNDEVDYDWILKHPIQVYETLPRIFYVLMDYDNGESCENDMQMMWNDLAILEKLKPALPILFDQALRVAAMYPADTHSFSVEGFQERIIQVNRRFDQRIVELHVQDEIDTLKEIWCIRTQDTFHQHKEGDFVDYPFKFPEELSDNEATKSAESFARLSQWSQELAQNASVSENQTHKAYLDELVYESQSLMCQTGNYTTQDVLALNPPSDCDGLNTAIKDELYEISDDSDALYAFTRQVYANLYYNKGNGQVSDSFALDESMLSDAGFQMNVGSIEWRTHRELNIARLAVTKIKIFADHLSKNKCLMPEEKERVSLLKKFMQSVQKSITLLIGRSR